MYTVYAHTERRSPKTSCVYEMHRDMTEIYHMRMKFSSFHQILNIEHSNSKYIQHDAHIHTCIICTYIHVYFQLPTGVEINNPFGKTKVLNKHYLIYYTLYTGDIHRI